MAAVGDARTNMRRSKTTKGDIVNNNNNPTKNKKKKSRGPPNRFGRSNFQLNKIDDSGIPDYDDDEYYQWYAIDDIEWGDMKQACCDKPRDSSRMTACQFWCQRLIPGFFGILVVLYVFLFALDLLGTAAKVMGGCKGGQILNSPLLSNPLCALVLAWMATALVQSSSTTTSIVVSMVSSGAITVPQGIYMVMGANLGTTVTNDLMALGHIGNDAEFERAFAIGTLHDLFNLLTVLILFPLELLTGYLEKVTSFLVEGAETRSGESWSGPMDYLVEPLRNLIIIADKKKIQKVAEGKFTCEDFYPTACDNGDVSYGSCDTYGFIKCDKSTGLCPITFKDGADLAHDQWAGAITMIFAMILCYICVVALGWITKYMVNGVNSQIVHTVTTTNGYFGIVLGTGFTMILQSSSLMTSIIVPFVATGVWRLDTGYAITLGANIGTTLSSILGALVKSGVDALQVALVHLFFNVTGVLVWYPIPYLRRFPIWLARKLGRCVVIWRPFAFIYIALFYIVAPLLLLGLASLMENDQKALGGVLIALTCVVVLGGTVWCWCLGGGNKTAKFIREHRVEFKMPKIPTGNGNQPRLASDKNPFDEASAELM